MDLSEARTLISEIDEQMVQLFVRRMGIVTDVARYKLERDLAVLDADRERAVLDRVQALAGPELGDDARRLYECVMALSRARQEKLIAAWRAGEADR